MKNTEQPSEQEMIDFLNKRMPLLLKRVEYQRLDTELVELNARRLEAIAKISHFQPQDNDNKSTSS